MTESTYPIRQDLLDLHERISKLHLQFDQLKRENEEAREQAKETRKLLEELLDRKTRS